MWLRICRRRDCSHRHAGRTVGVDSVERVGLEQDDDEVVELFAMGREQIGHLTVHPGDETTDFVVDEPLGGL